MAKYPLLYDPGEPYKHYEKAAKLYKKARTSLGYAVVMPVIAFAAGIVCSVFSPSYLAFEFLFGIASLLLSIFGSKTYTPLLCLLGAITAGVSAALLAAVDSPFAFIGMALHVLSLASMLAAIPAINQLIKLRELPGFPHFDPALNNLSFSAMETLGANEILNIKLPEDKVREERLAARSEIKQEDDSFPAPEKEKEETVAERKKRLMLERREKEGENSYGEGYSGNNENFDKMAKANPRKNDSFSDIDLFD